MKKLLFTALAVVAFSGVSMAETREAISEVKVVKEQLEATPCQDAAINLYELVIGQEDDNIDLLNALLALCK